MPNTHQSAIFDESTIHHVLLEFDVTDKSTALPKHVPFEVASSVAVQVVGLGVDYLKQLGLVPVPTSLGSFKSISGLSGKVAPAAQSDLMIWIHSRIRGEAFAHALAWKHCLLGVAELRHESHGFKFRDSRDLTGFVDGSANPKPDVREGLTIIDDGECQGGAIVLAQRWVHSLANFEKLAEGEQEKVIGRTKPDSIELTGDAMPPNSHVSRTDIKRNGKAVKIFRRSFPAGGIADAGLQFLAFAQNQSSFEQLLHSMYGIDDSVSDRLLEYSTPVSGGFYYAPPLEHLERLR